MKAIYSAAGLVFFVLAGCSNVDSSKVAPTEIYTAYSSGYSEDTNKVTTTASFTVGKGVGTQVTLDEGASVRWNNSPMRRISGLLGGVHYEGERNAYTHEEITRTDQIVYTDNQGRTYFNTVKIPSPVRVAGGSRVGGDVVVPWSIDDALSAHERIHATLTYSRGAVFASDGFGSRTGQIVFRASELHSITDSSVVVTVCRTKRYPSVNAPSVGGSLSSTYCSRAQRVNL